MSEIFYSVIEVAEILKLHPESLRRLIRNKKINAFKIGDAKKSVYRISEKEIERLKNEH